MKSGHYTCLLTLQAKASTGKHSAVISRVSHASCDQKMVNVPFLCEVLLFSPSQGEKVLILAEGDIL